MKKNTMMLLIAFVVLIGGASIAYNSLQKSGLQEEATNQSTEEQEQPHEEVTEKNNDTAVAKKIAAPNFTVFNKDGEKVRFSEFVGKPTIINFWATW